MKLWNVVNLFVLTVLAWEQNWLLTVECLVCVLSTRVIQLGLIFSVENRSSWAKPGCMVWGSRRGQIYNSQSHCVSWNCKIKCQWCQWSLQEMVYTSCQPAKCTETSLKYIGNHRNLRNLHSLSACPPRRLRLPPTYRSGERLHARCYACMPVLSPGQVT